MIDAPKKMEKKSLLTLDLETLIPSVDEMSMVDLKDYLFKGLIIKEAEFRLQVADMSLEQYRGRYVALTCSTTAIIPLWAYMLISARLASVAIATVYGAPQELEELLLLQKLQQHNWSLYDGQRVVLKGCGEKKLSPHVFTFVTNQLVPRVRSLMFGEPCSTVPVFKKEIE